MRYVGLDVGFGYTKAFSVGRDGTRSLVFPSIVSPAVELDFRSGLENGTQTLEHRALFLAALALLAESPDDTFAVVTGLPVDDFDDRALILDNLAGRFHLTLGRRDVHLEIRNLMVVPQPYGALMDLIFKDTHGNLDERYAGGLVGIVDIGFKTTDFVLVRAGEFIQKLSGSLKKGMSLVYQAAVSKFTARYPGDWDLHNVEKALRDGAVRSLGRRLDVDPSLVAPDLSGLAEEIAAWIQGRWSGEPVDSLICTGGGSLLLEPYLLKAFPQMAFMDDPQQANVRGFYSGPVPPAFTRSFYPGQPGRPGAGTAPGGGLPRRERPSPLGAQHRRPEPLSPKPPGGGANPRPGDRQRGHRPDAGQLPDMGKHSGPDQGSTPGSLHQRLGRGLDPPVLSFPASLLGGGGAVSLGE
ncbi:MAG: hypothetical protein HY760_09155 [Nitrospirae bacterium]|nr:hypothetical protein [Nitrospirota bacterium]